MWDNDISFVSNSKTSGMDAVLFSSPMSELTSYGRSKSKKATTLKEGSRVVAHTNNGILIPGQLPPAGTKGTVVGVETPDGKISHIGNEIFVKFDGRNKIERIPTDFLKLAGMRVSSIDDHFIVLSGPSLMGLASDKSSTLVHKATKDLWSVKVSEDGSYDLERLFDDNGDPLKI